MRPVEHVCLEKTPNLFFMPRSVTESWLSNIPYVVGDIRLYNSRAYVCLADHTSDTFATDFADGKWKQEKLFNSGTDEIPVWTIYDRIFDESAEVTGKAVRRRVKDGVQKVHLEPDQMTYYYNDELVATAIIIPQYWQVNHWADFAQPLDDYIDVTEDGHLVGSGTQGGFSWNIDIGFQKWTVNLVAPGITVRAVWEITFTSLGQQLLADGVLRFSTEDYLGNISDDQGVSVRTVIFEPDGSIDGLVIDPYLTIDEQTSYIWVYCDGYAFYLDLGSATEDIIEVYNAAGSSKYIDVDIMIDTGSTQIAGYAVDEALVLEDTPIRKVIKVIGGFSSTASDANPLQDNNSNDVILEIYIYLYDDHFIVDQRIKIVNGYINVDASQNTSLPYFDLKDAVLTNAAVYYENSGTESAGDDAEHNGTDYQLGTSDQIHIQMIVLDYNVTGTATFFQEPTSGTIAGTGLENGTLTTGETSFVTLCIIDSVEREGSAKVYDQTARLALGNQWKDMIGPSITDGLGAQETDWLIPLHIGTGICSDAAQHLENDGDSSIRLTADIDRVKHKFLVSSADCFKVGDPASPTNLLVGHWKCEDNAASTVLIDETGSYNGTLVGGDNTSTLHSTTSKRGGSLITNGTDDYFDLSSALAGLQSGAVTDFTVLLRFNPAFSYTGASFKYILTIQDTSTDRVTAYFNQNLGHFLVVDNINAAGAFIHNVWLSVPNDYIWQQFHNVLLGVSLTYNIIYINIDGHRWWHTLTDTTWGTAPDTLYVARYGSGYSDCYFDDVKLLNACVLPYGAFFTDEGNTYGNPHEYVTFYWAGSDTTPIGSDVTKSGDYLTDGPLGKKAFNPTASTGYATAVTSGNISSSEGELNFWVKNLDTLAADATFLFADTGFRIWWDDSDNDIVFSYGSTPDTVRTATAITDGEWHHVRVWWKSAVEIGIEVDGYNSGVLTSGVDSATTLDTNMYFNADDASGTNLADVLTANWTVVSKMGTPQIWTALGQGPLLLNQVRIS